MIRTFVDSVLDLSDLEMFFPLTSPMKAQLRILRMKCRFLQIYLWCLAKSNEASRGKSKKNLKSVRKSLSRIEALLRKARKGPILARDMGEWKDWDILVSDLLGRIQNCKPEIKKSSLDLLHSLFRSKFSGDELHRFMFLIRISLENLVISLKDADTNTIVEKKMQIETLQEKVNLFREFFSFARERCRNHKQLEALRIHLQAWACKAACLSILYWVAKEDDGEESNELRLNILLSDLLQKIRPPCNREVTGLCFRVLKASEPLPSESVRVGELVFNLLVFLLENLDSPLKGNVGIFQSELVFLVTFFMGEKFSPTAANDESILTPMALGIPNRF